MKSKSGNKLKKIRGLTLAALALTGCLMSPEPKTVHRDYSVGPECLAGQDSTTFTDSSQVKLHYTCTAGDSTHQKGNP